MNNSDQSAMPVSISITPAGDVYYGDIGLTKREYFAGLAMEGLIARGYKNLTLTSAEQNIAAESIILADALLTELDKKKA